MKKKDEKGEWFPEFQRESKECEMKKYSDGYWKSCYRIKKKVAKGGLNKGCKRLITTL